MAERRKRTRASTAESQRELRLAIIDAACRLFRRGGYEAVSMRKVAQQVGCTAGALYRYFPDKQSLLLHVWEDEMRYLAEYVRGATDRTDDPLEKVRQTMLGYLRYWMQNAETFRVMFALVPDGLDRSEAPDIFPTTGSTALYFEVRPHLEALLAGRPNAPQDPDLALQCLLTGVHGILALQMSASHFPWFDVEEMGAVLIDGMLAGWGLLDKPSVTASALRRRQPPPPETKGGGK